MSSASAFPENVERFDVVERVLGPADRRNQKQIRFLHEVLGRFSAAARAKKWAKFILFGGAGGGGKSYVMRWSALLFLIYAYRAFGVKHVGVGLFCEDYPVLRGRQISKMRAEFPEFLGRLTDHRDLGLVWLMPENLGGGFIALRNLDKPEKYHSFEFAGVFVDEFTQNKNAGEIFDELRFRLRWPGFPEDFVFPFAAGTNPGGPGHQFVKDLWIDGALPVELETVREQFLFIQALAADNPYLSPRYYQDLLTLPEDLRRAYAFGDWDSFAGQYFTEWRRSVHVSPRFKIPHYWQRFTAEDWGFDPGVWCRLWFAVSPEGRVFAYREQYEKRRLPEYMAREGLRLSQGEVIRYHALDPNAWSTVGQSHGMTGPSIGEQLQTHGWPCVKADNSRIPGWQHVRGYLHYERDAQGRVTVPPMFQVLEGTCPNLLRTLPGQVHDKFDREDLDTTAEDHAADALRYGLMSRPKVTMVPLEEMPDEYAEAALRAAHEENPGSRSYEA